MRRDLKVHDDVAPWQKSKKSRQASQCLPRAFLVSCCYHSTRGQQLRPPSGAVEAAAFLWMDLN